MKNFTLLKQRIVGHEAEPQEFKQAKKDALAMKDSMTKICTGLKAWLDGARAMAHAAQTMSAALEQQDAELDLFAKTVSHGLADSQTGSGLALVAIDSITKKIAWINELSQKTKALDTKHLDWSRAKRKLAEAQKPNVKPETLAHAQVYLRNSEDAYQSLYKELLASFNFIIEEATDPATNQLSPNGLLKFELAAFKAAQYAFFNDCANVTRSMAATSETLPDISQVWSQFCERRLRAIADGATTVHPPSGPTSQAEFAESGKNLLRRGFSQSGAGAAVPPPPPATSGGTAKALYSYAAAGPDELNLYEGQIVGVVAVADDGWATVTDQATGQTGLVPASYIE